MLHTSLKLDFGFKDDDMKTPEIGEPSLHILASDNVQEVVSIFHPILIASAFNQNFPPILFNLLIWLPNTEPIHINGNEDFRCL